MTWTTFLGEKSTLGNRSCTALSTVYIVTGSPNPWVQSLSSPPGSGILSPIKVCGTISSRIWRQVSGVDIEHGECSIGAISEEPPGYNFCTLNKHLRSVACCRLVVLWNGIQ
jgi:hypothetical protein